MEADQENQEANELTADLEDVQLDDDDADSEDGVDLEFYDNSHFVFAKHEGSVFVVNIDDAFSKFVVSGGEDDRAFVWQIESGEVLFECAGHKDSVTCACFSADSKFVATGDMSGIIKVWKLDTKKEVCMFETSDLEWLTWHPVAPILMAGTQDGNVWLWKIPSGESKLFQSPGCACTSGKIMFDGKSAAFGYGDGSVRMYDLKSEQCLHALTKGRDMHRDGLNHIECTKDGQLILTASLDGSCKVINTKTGKVSTTHRCDQIEDGENSVEYVTFSERLHLAAIASLNGDLTLFDLRSGHVRHKCQHPDGVTRSHWTADETRLVTGCLDGISRMWDARSGAVINTYVGHTDQILDTALSKNDKWFLSASSDGTVRLYSTDLKEDETS